MQCFWSSTGCIVGVNWLTIVRYMLPLYNTMENFPLLRRAKSMQFQPEGLAMPGPVLKTYIKDNYIVTCNTDIGVKKHVSFVTHSTDNV